MLPIQHQRSLFIEYAIIGGLVGALAGFAAAVSDAGSSGNLLENRIIMGVIFGAATGASIGMAAGALMESAYRRRNFDQDLGRISPDIVVKILVIFVVVISSGSLVRVSNRDFGKK